jgi:hypothetical protein
VNEEGRSLVRAGERAFARAGAQPSSPYVFNSAQWDAFDQWSESRRDERLGVSAQYLPPDVRPYSTSFDQYGAWRYEQEYGYVWYPRVAVGWRPYYHGRWVGLRPYGWTWIAGDPWGWPTHHYGRWGFSAGGWFWIPGRTWGPAWVSWAYAPHYVSWCPLGWNNRPLFSFVNVNLNYYRGHHYSPWHGWTVVPRRHFGVGYVNVNVVAGHSLGTHIRGSFVERTAAPAWHYRGSREAIPIVTAGRTGYAVPRGTGTALSSSVDRNRYPSASRSFPAPAREPRAAQVIGGTTSRAAAPVTIAPQRAVPRDRGVRADALDRSSNRSNDAGTTGISRSSGVRSDVDRSNDQRSPVPPAGTRAIPRGTVNDSAERPSASGWRTYDRPPARTGPRSAPESRPYSVPEPGGRRAFGTDGSGAVDRYRAVPRQDAPRPSYEAPRPSPRSYGAPSQDSRPSSDGGAPDRRGGPSASQPSRGDSPSNSGGSRSRGGQPSQGQAVRRSRG